MLKRASHAFKRKVSKKAVRYFSSNSDVSIFRNTLFKEIHKCIITMKLVFLIS